jgi:hypothetical protein
MEKDASDIIPYILSNAGGFFAVCINTFWDNDIATAVSLDGLTVL